MTLADVFRLASQFVFGQMICFSASEGGTPQKLRRIWRKAESTSLSANRTRDLVKRNPFGTPRHSVYMEHTQLKFVLRPGEVGPLTVSCKNFCRPETRRRVSALPNVLVFTFDPMELKTRACILRCFTICSCQTLSEV